MMSASEEKTTSDEVDSTKRPANASPIPVLGEGFQESRPAAVPNAAESSDDQQDASQEDPKLGKRRLFGFGRKKDEKGKGKKKVELDQSGKPMDSNRLSCRASLYYQTTRKYVPNTVDLSVSIPFTA